MSNPCSDPLCEGNCPGCKNGQVWCQDPRCSPFCPGQQCIMPRDFEFNGNLVMATIILSLLTILFILWFIYGPQFFEEHSDHERAGVVVPDEMMK